MSNHMFCRVSVPSCCTSGLDRDPSSPCDDTDKVLLRRRGDRPQRDRRVVLSPTGGRAAMSNSRSTMASNSMKSSNPLPSSSQDLRHQHYREAPPRVTGRGHTPYMKIMRSSRSVCRLAPSHMRRPRNNTLSTSTWSESRLRPCAGTNTGGEALQLRRQSRPWNAPRPTRWQPAGWTKHGQIYRG